MNLDRLSKYAVEDSQKRQAIDDILHPAVECTDISFDDEMCCLKNEYTDVIVPEKYCPKCKKKFQKEDIICFNCGVRLKDIKDVSIADLDITPAFVCKKADGGFGEIFSQENIDKISRFNLKITEFKNIITGITMASLKTLDGAVKDNDIFIDNLDIRDKVLLFSKAFVEVDFKSYGGELGYFQFNKISIDDRQLSALQITTLLHELSHFLLKEIIAQILCRLLECEKTSQIESVAVFILSYTPINQLVDEYCAHTVEGRFTLFGYQDYSSYLNIERTIDLPDEEIDMIKTIGNSFSIHIKKILESYIDDELLEDIKTRFRQDILDRPNYEYLALENCTMLKNPGMIQAIKLIVKDGFMIAMENIETLEEYNRQWE